MVIDFIKMALQFRTEWKAAHPPPPGPEREEEEKKKKSASRQCLKCLFIVGCCPLWLLWQCCCTKRRTDPYDDGQDDFGVNYKEYLKWKSGEEIEDRQLPQSYHAISTAEIERKLQKAVDKRVEKVNAKIDNKKQAVTKTYETNVAGLKKTQDDLKSKGKLFGNKLKKKMGMQMKLSKRNDEDDNQDIVP